MWILIYPPPKLPTKRISYKVSTFDPVSDFKYQVGQAYSDCIAIKAVNVKPGKSNYHVSVVGEVLNSMYPHPNKTDLYTYDDYMNKAVRKYQSSLKHPSTGILTIEELQMLGESSGKFKLV